MAADLKKVSVEVLKSAFKEGATPNEEDYHALIDLAAVGSKALGADERTPTNPKPGLGLKMDKGKLVVSPGNGVMVDEKGVAVKVDGKAVIVTADGVGINVKANGGLESNSEGLHVKAGPGLKTDKDGLEIKLAEKGGLKADNDGLAVQVAAGGGLEFDASTGLKVKLKADQTDNYIQSTDTGLAITEKGIGKIKDALKSTTLDALEKAVAGTSKGYKTDSNNSAAEDVEANIAVKLNEAFTEGWHLTQPRDALLKALKAFHENNKNKVYNGALIATSPGKGKSGLFNQEGTEYGKGTVIAYRVNPAGIAEAVAPGADYKADGIYALVGKLDANGAPTPGDPYEKVTPYALMAMVVQGDVTVVGHWDFSRIGEPKGGGWGVDPWSAELAKRLELRRIESDLKPKWENNAADKQKVKDKSFYDGELARIRTTHDTQTATLTTKIADLTKQVDSIREQARDGRLERMARMAVSLPNYGDNSPAMSLELEEEGFVVVAKVVQGHDFVRVRFGDNDGPVDRPTSLSGSFSINIYDARGKDLTPDNDDGDGYHNKMVLVKVKPWGNDAIRARVNMTTWYEAKTRSVFVKIQAEQIRLIADLIHPLGFDIELWSSFWVRLFIGGKFIMLKIAS